MKKTLRDTLMRVAARSRGICIRRRGLTGLGGYWTWRKGRTFNVQRSTFNAEPLAGMKAEGKREGHLVGRWKLNVGRWTLKKTLNAQCSTLNVELSCRGRIRCSAGAVVAGGFFGGGLSTHGGGEGAAELGHA